MSLGYPSPAAPASVRYPTTPSGGTAESLILVAFVLQAIVSTFALGGLTYLFAYTALHPYPYAWAAVSAAAAAVVGIGLLLYAGYGLAYRRAHAGAYASAQTPALLVGILTLFVGLIPGILYLIGYVKLSDAVREQQPMGAPMSGFFPQIACRSCGRVYPVGGFAFCPNCGQKLST